MSEKLYVGNIKVVNTKYGDIVKIGLSKQDREKLEQYQSQSGWVNINIMTSPQGKKYATIDTYGLEKEVKQDRPSTSTNTPDEINLEQIPF